MIQVSDNSFFASYDPTAVNFFRKTSSGALELVHHPPDPHGWEWRNPWWTRSRLYDYFRERRFESFVKPRLAEDPEVTRLRAVPPPPPASRHRLSPRPNCSANTWAILR